MEANSIGGVGGVWGNLTAVRMGKNKHAFRGWGQRKKTVSRKKGKPGEKSNESVKLKQLEGSRVPGFDRKGDRIMREGKRRGLGCIM